MRIKVSYWYDTETDQLVAGAGTGHDAEVMVTTVDGCTLYYPPDGPGRTIHNYYPESFDQAKRIARRAAAEIQGTGEAGYR